MKVQLDWLNARPSAIALDETDLTPNLKKMCSTLDVVCQESSVVLLEK